MRGDPSPAIRLEGIAKQYGRVVALGDVSLEVAPAEIFGFLGLNGAGKTTAIRILLDLVRPTSGRASIFGLSCQDRGSSVRAQIGYLPGELGFYRDMTGEETLDLLSHLGSRPADSAVRRGLLDRFEFSHRDLRRKIREYSTGMKRKLGIVQAFQSQAPLLILDEPTEGLDPLMQDALYALLDETRRGGRTVFMSSHVLPEVERVCDRIAVLREGRLVLLSTVAEVRRLVPRDVRILFRTPVAVPAVWPESCHAVAVTPRAWTVQVRGPLGPVISMVAALPIEDLIVREPHLEEVLRRYYKDETVQ